MRPRSAAAAGTGSAMPRTSEAIAAAIGGFAAAGAWRDDFAWWALLVAVVLTWISGLDYARVAPRLWRGGAPA